MGERLALLVRSVALLARLLGAVRELARTRVHFGALPQAVVAPLPPIRDEELLDKRGRPLRGAARSARIGAIERRRAAERVAVAPAPAGRVIVLPRIPLPDRAALSALRALPAIRAPLVSVRGLRLLAITVTATFVFATIIGTTGIVNSRGTVAFGASTTLSVISGQVSARSSDTDAFQPIADGATLHAGMTIHTAADTYAVLTYFEGSTVSLDPNTTLVIKALQANPDGSTVISMEQQIGRTWHSVTHLLKPDSKYEVTTPTATATVRGTMFDVGVESDAQGEIVTTVQTVQGAVATSKAPTPQEPQPKEEVVVRPGFEVSVTTAAPLPQPKPAPPPQREVTVTVGAAAGVVLDPVGRANGIKDGKVVVQTPGAQVRVVDGKLVVTLPEIPDGKIATVVERKDAPQREVDVETTMTEQGQRPQTTTDRIDTSQTSGPQVVAVEVAKGTAVQVTPVTPQQMQTIASNVKVAQAPKLAPTTTAASAGSGQNAGSDQGNSDQSGSGQSKGDQGPAAPGGPPTGFVPALQLQQLPSLATGGTNATGAFTGRQDQSGQQKTTGQQQGGQTSGSTGGQQQGGPQQGGSQQGGSQQGGSQQGGSQSGGSQSGGQQQSGSGSQQGGPPSGGGQQQGGSQSGGQQQGGSQSGGGQQQGGSQQGGSQQGGSQSGGSQSGGGQQQGGSQQGGSQSGGSQSGGGSQGGSQSGGSQQGGSRSGGGQQGGGQQGGGQTAKAPNSSDTSNFLPHLSLPRLPVGSNDSAHNDSSGPRLEAPKFELPRVPDFSGNKGDKGSHN